MPAPGIDSEEDLFNDILDRYQRVRDLATWIARVLVVQVQAGVLGGSLKLGYRYPGHMKIQLRPTVLVGA